ncbi:hypothetical protein SASPL_107340 [Salvia splendens]|uniref:Uncharacterized protein n=1 Tax=Salvia splendens TaxID=180675 RepID=A0A8X8YEP3_SALSN|nr:hypothetical protein SASPL_107340 [Salvia splendens]
MVNSSPLVVDWEIPLIRKRKFMSEYDPRVPMPRDARVRKMVSAKCVRSCRDKRLSMKEVARCLGELSKLNSWNGLSNPCIMGKDVEIVETPLKNQQLELEVRSNLMELMV